MTRLLEEREPDVTEPVHNQGGLSLLRVAWQRKALIVLGAVIGLVFGSLYYAQRTPVYQSAMQVLVVKKRADALPAVADQSALGYPDDYLANHIALLRSPLIVTRAVKKLDVSSLKTFAGQGDPMAVIIGGLSVSRDSSNVASGNYNNILNLSFRGTVPDECKTILDAIADGYKDYLDETYKNVSDNTLELITNARNILNKEQATQQAEYDKFRMETPLLIKGKEGTNIHQERLAAIEAKRSELIVRRAGLQGRLQAIEAALKNGRSRADLAALLSEQQATKQGTQPNGQKPTSAIDEQLFNLQLNEALLLEDYGPDHPLVQAVRKKIQVTRDYQANQQAARGFGPDGAGRGDGTHFRDPLDFYIQSLKQELADLDVAEKPLTEAFERENTATKELIKEELKEATLRRNLSYTTQLYESVVKRLQDIDILRDFGGYDAQKITPATTGWKIEPRPFPIFSVAIFLGVLGGFGLAYLAEVSDKSFRTPEEIRRRLGLPVIGHIPYLKQDGPVEVDANGSNLDPVLCTYYRSKSTEAEAYRGVRTALYFSIRGQGHQVIQVTSPNKADGKSTLAANLAISMAQSGKRTILLDADFRKPRIHKTFGISTSVGLASVIAGTAELTDAIQPSAVPGLSLMPCGPIPPNPAELLTSPRLKELLDSLRTRFDFVVVDTPPLLAVTDPCAVAPRVDGVLLVVRVSKNGRPYAERAKEILAALGANVLGVVVNGVGSRQAGYGGYGGYSQGSYRYGYGSYAYSYGDGSGDYYDTPADGSAAKSLGTGTNGHALPGPSTKGTADEA